MSPWLPVRLALLGLACVAAACGGGSSPSDDAATNADADRVDQGSEAAPAGSDPTSTPIFVDTEAHLVVVSHAEESIVGESTVTVRGISEPGATITYRDTPATMSPDGTWSVEVELEPGANVATFHVTDAAGNAASRDLLLRYDPDLASEPSAAASSPGQPAPNPAAASTFSAEQKYGSSHEELPYDLFSGTAAPGAKISVSSPFGSDSTMADDTGHWELRVYFVQPPQNAQFEVKVSDGVHTQHFEFIHIV